jgi:hypothetical protein
MTFGTRHFTGSIETRLLSELRLSTASAWLSVTV